MSEPQVARMLAASCLSCLAAISSDLADASGARISRDQEQLIAPAQEALLIRSYRRCVSAGPEHNRTRDAATLLSASYPFDVDALSLLTAKEVDAAPREAVNGTTFISCGWFGPPGANGKR